MGIIVLIDLLGRSLEEQVNVDGGETERMEGSRKQTVVSLLPLRSQFSLLLKCLTQHHETLYKPPPSHPLYFFSFCPAFVRRCGKSSMDSCDSVGQEPLLASSRLSNVESARQASKGTRRGSLLEL